MHQTQSAISSFTTQFNEFLLNQKETISRLTAQIGDNVELAEDLLDDYAAALKSRLGSMLANAASNDEDAQDEAISTAEAWVTDNVSNSTIEHRLFAILWLAGVQNGEAAILKTLASS